MAVGCSIEKPTKRCFAKFDCSLCYDPTGSIKDMGKPAVTHRPYIHGHDMYLLSRGKLRLVGFAVRSSENRHYLGPDHVGSNHARQVQGEHCHEKTRGQFIHNKSSNCYKNYLTRY